MRILAATVFVLVGCAPTARVILPAEAPVGRVAMSAPAPVEEEVEVIADDPFSADDLVPCTDEADKTAASKALENLSSKITVLDDAATPAVAATVDELKQLLTTKCFLLAAVDMPDALAFDTGKSFKHWWSEGDGYGMLAGYVRGSPMRVMVLPEKPRATLLLDGHEQSPLAPLLCPANDWGCGQMTSGWVRRAERRLSQPNPAFPLEPDSCATQIAAAEPADRWATFLSCRGSVTPRHAMLPLGNFKPPTDGLFVLVEGYRCHELVVYDLATGARISANACTRMNNAPFTRVGRVPVASLREAAWMMMLAGVTENDYRPVAQLEVPKDVTPGRPAESGTGESGGMGSIGGTSRRGVWSWFRKNKQGRYVGQISGERWRGAAWEATEHADELLELANDAFDDTCAPALPRAALAAMDWSQVGPSSNEPSSDIGSTMSQADVGMLQRIVISAKSPPTCTTAL